MVRSINRIHWQRVSFGSRGAGRRDGTEAAAWQGDNLAGTRECGERYT